ncbi:class I SAM-dependent methyltransferase [Nostoc sp. C057]|uniref:AprA-related methyltransferase n=1 Tax=Nostoc sp. C057 TaxID=2576903 RepID=UPI0015C32454|nr:class I SAM-dependent methyltransferase [Nostoc sp. C057]QLE49260.1 class I SAM-dependent methyltransferase [Nostoc sp. C057]
MQLRDKIFGCAVYTRSDILDKLFRPKNIPDLSDGDSEERKERLSVRRTIFLHLDGIAIGPTTNALQERGVFFLFEEGKVVPLNLVLKYFPGNIGYLNVALRLMVSQGWMKHQEIEGEIFYTLTRRGSIALGLSSIYKEFVAFLPTLININDYLFGDLTLSLQSKLADGMNFSSLLARAKRQWDLVESTDEDYQYVCCQILHHLNGLLVGPTMVSLAMANVFEQIDPKTHTLDIEQLTGNQKHLLEAFEILALQGWVVIQGRQVQFIGTGLYAISRAYAYGVTVSYLPTFEKVPELLFGNPAILSGRDTDGHETHVNRRVNIWGSGLAHQTYFQKVDAIIRDIFNRPIDEQPKGIVDMGCGDGTFMEHIYHVIQNQTVRGKFLNENPLIMVCADYNQASREATYKRLKDLQSPISVIFGDINDPDDLAKAILAKYGIPSDEFLHVRSFLDHNRPFITPRLGNMGCELSSTGAFVCRGRMITANELLQNLLEHLQRWKPHIGRFGLLVLDLHTIPPALAAANIGYTLATAYDATHGYTDQYPIEMNQFIAAAKLAGLTPDLRYQAKFPPNDLATVSLNLFVPMEVESGELRSD